MARFVFECLRLGVPKCVPGVSSFGYRVLFSSVLAWVSQSVCPAFLHMFEFSFCRFRLLMAALVSVGCS